MAMGLTAKLLPLWGCCREATEGARRLRRCGGKAPLHHFVVPLPQWGRSASAVLLPIEGEGFPYPLVIAE
jgi:hypothetical protein